MKLSELAAKSGLKILTHPDRAAGLDIRHTFACNRVSDLLSDSSGDSLLITTLSNVLLQRAACLVDAPAVCIVSTTAIDPDVVQAALESGVVLIQSELPLSETCGLLSDSLSSSPMEPPRT